MNKTTFSEYFEDWIYREKNGTVRKVTFDKYRMSSVWLKKINPTVTIEKLDRKTYQEIINEYGKTHERQTVKDFHTQLKACVTELFEERKIDRNPALRVTFTGIQPKKKGSKFMSLAEVGKLIDTLNLDSLDTMDWPILIMAKTGIRFAECMGLTAGDFDFENLKLTIDKTWNYKEFGGFSPTKNHSSIRKIEIDWQIAAQLQPLIDKLPEDEPIFVQRYGNGYKKVYNSTFNDFLRRKCREAGVPEISIHGLRHTHGSVLLGQGVSVLSVSKRLGHSNVTTTQEVYLHITDELARKDKQLMMGALAGIK